MSELINREFLKRGIKDRAFLKRSINTRAFLKRDTKIVFMKDLIFSKDRETNFKYYYDMMLDHYDDKYWVSQNKFQIYVSKENKKESVTCSISILIQNIIAWELLTLLDEDIFDKKVDVSYIRTETFKDYTISNYADKLLDLFDFKTHDMSQLNEKLSTMTENLAFMSEDFAKYKSFSMDLWGLAEVYLNEPEFRKLYNKTINPDLQACEIEHENERDIRKMIGILSRNNTSFSCMIQADKLTKSKQLCEFILNAELRPDMDGNTFPYPIQSNFVKGLKSIPDQFQDASGAMKAAVLNKRNTGDAGYLSTQVSLVTISRTFNKEPGHVCDTHFPLSGIAIKTKEHLKRFNKRYYFVDDPDDIQLINSDRDDHLIGTEINLFSPLTCDSGEHICYRCYGDLAYVNASKHIGVLAALLNTEAITQLMLSAKHLLKTCSDMLEFPEFVFNYLDLKSSVMEVKYLPSSSFKNKFIIIHDDDIMLANSNDNDNLEFNKFINKFYIEDNGVTKMVTETASTNLYITPAFNKFLKRKNHLKENSNKEKYYRIPFTKLCGNESVDPTILFTMEIVNNELTKPLARFKKLLENDHLGCRTMTQLVNKMVDVLIESKLPSMSIHSEVILSSLIRKKSNKLERPDFTDDDMEYVMLGLQSAILSHPSVEVSMAFQKLPQQIFTNPLTYQKDKSSLLITGGLNK